jgi:HD-GYP domain-containing protein (c-di-GMP phosphodiesterase class II)
MSTFTAELDAATERRHEESFERRARKMDRRELLVLVPLNVAFFAAAVALVALAEPARALSLPLAAAFMVAYAVADRIEFSTGTGYAIPTQLVFVPMLLLLPAPVVPLLVSAAVVLSAVPAVVRGDLTPGRGLLGASDAFFSVGPALVLVMTGAQLPEWSHVPAYVVALGAQHAFDGAYFAVRMRLLLGMPARETLGEMRLARRVDTLLFPIGLLAAIAAADAPAGALLVLALVPLLVGFGREREASIQRSLELGRAYRGTALLLRDLLEEDDEYTGHHTEDVVELSVKVAVEMGVSEDVRRETEMGALLHDIGKIAVPDEIINKPGPLDDDEWAIMKTHTVEGERMLQRVGGLLSSVGVVVRASHERWDGGGYPDGLAGEAIPVAARIVSACDAFNAMTTDRSYRKALPLEVAIAELRANSGSQFAPDVADALIAVVARETPDWELTIVEAPRLTNVKGAG